MEVYTESTKPIIEYYASQGKLIKIDADKEADVVLEETIKTVNE